MQTQHTVKGGGDLELNVLEWGRRDGPAILLIHGWSQASLCWRKQYESELVHAFRLIAFDLRGHGMSAAPTDPACYQDPRLWADDVRAILTTLAVGPVVLVGWSYGSFVIADYLRAYGAGGILGINLVGGGVRFGEQAIGTYIGAGFSGLFARAISRDLTVSIDAMREFIDRCFAVKMSRQDYERVLCFNMTARPDVRAAMVARDIEVEAPLRAYHGPLLVSHGRRDTMVLPATVELVRELCPQAQISWYDDAAHGPFFEAPEKFNRELAEFVHAAVAGARPSSANPEKHPGRVNIMKLNGPLVSTDWLAQHLDDADLRLFDATIFLKHKPEGGYIPDSGRAEWQLEHIPGAGFLDVDKELSDAHSDVSFMMPAPERFAAIMASHGVSDDSTVVLYNKGFPMWATRVWWMLRSIGFDNVAVLDGGYEKWKREGRATTAEVPHHAPGTLTARPRAGMWVDKDAMLEVVEGKGPVTVNALAPAVYSGEKNQYGRPGHLPGTYNVYYGDLLDPVTGEFLAPDKLRPLFAQSGALESERVIAYCGGGISATMDALAMLVCGQDKVAIYDGSMSEWVKDPKLPLKLGMEP